MSFLDRLSKRGRLFSEETLAGLQDSITNNPENFIGILLDFFKNLAGGTTTHTEIVIGATEQGRKEVDGISYGKPIEINASNIGKLGLPDDPQTLIMDESGNFEFGGGYTKYGARAFLYQLSSYPEFVK